MIFTFASMVGPRHKKTAGQRKKRETTTQKNTHVLTYTVNRPLAYYRRTCTPLSVNKLKAAKRTWYPLQHVKKLPGRYCIQNFVWYEYNKARRYAR